MIDWTAVFEPVWTVSVLPSGPTPFERAMEAVDADLVARDPVGLIPAARSDQNAPLAWLPYLAAERSVDEYSGAWPESRQRAVVAASFVYHQHKGTRRALDEALRPLGYDVKVVEWFEVSPRRQPYTFRLRVTLGDTEAWIGSDRLQLLRVANGAKNAHTKIEAVSLIRTAPAAAMFVGGIVRRRRVLRFGQVPKPTTIRTPAHVFVGALQRRIRKLTILPRQ
ncbi:MAG: phage tail protein I [Aurantimonas coralicida]|nr:phage tail protein I [Aurantimonas coralicida]